MSEDKLQVSLGERPAPLVLKNARIINVFTGEIDPPADIAVVEGVIAGVGPYRGTREVDLGGRLVCPGLIDGHVHLESAMVTPAEFARAVVPRATTTVVADPHEVANVAGLDGIRFLLEASERLPLTVFFSLPSCVPATPFDESGARLAAEDLGRLLDDPRVVALGEVMDVPSVLNREPGMIAKLQRFGSAGKIIDGHAPGLSGYGLNAYIVAGVGSDHECTTPDEAREKLRLGMRLMIREGSAARDLDALLPTVTATNSRRCLLVTDDRNPEDLVNEGHLDFLVRRAIAGGLDPITVIRMASLNAAEYFGLGGRPGRGPRRSDVRGSSAGAASLGAVAPGYQADLVVLDDLETFKVHQVFCSGVLAAEDGRPLFESATGPAGAAPGSSAVTGTCHIRPVTPRDLRIRAREVPAKVIEVAPGRIVTDQLLLLDLPVRDDAWQADPERDVLKLTVAERHRGSGLIGRGFVRGFGLTRGALASSVAHDAHNIVALGVSDQDIVDAITAVAGMGGGLAAVSGGKVVESLPLPLAGLMSDQPLHVVVDRLGRLHTLVHEWGVPDRLDPFMAMAFLSLAVIPELKLTARGLVDVERGELVD